MQFEARSNARSPEPGARVSSFVQRSALGLIVCCSIGCNNHQKSAPDPRGNALTASPASAAAPDSSARNDVGGKPSSMGEVAQAPSYSMQVHAAKTCQPPSWQRAKAGFARLGFDVEITGKSKLPVAANPFYARLIDQEGKAYRPVFGGCEPDLRHAPLASGQSARGYVSFEIPETAGQLSLRYQPQLSGPPEPLEFNLGTSPASAGQ